MAARSRTRTRVLQSSIALVMVGAFVLGFNACAVDDIDISNRECPCSAPGWACDTTRNVCVPLEQFIIDGSVIGPDGVVIAPDSAPPQDDGGPPKPECSLSPDDCPVGRYCLPSLECTPGCKTDAECVQLSSASPFCNLERHQCVACRTKNDCTAVPDQDCTSNGVCADKCTADAGTPCPGGKLCCNSVCIDPKSDSFNCNGCNIKCTGTGSVCCNSVCTSTLTSATNCGGCGTVCVTNVNSTSSYCSSGTCRFVCSTGYSHCQVGNTGCETSTSANVTQCGGCTSFYNCNTRVVNATGITCVASKCDYASCNAGFAECNGLKTDGCECTDCGNLNQPCCAVAPKCAGTLMCKNTGGVGFTCQP